MHIAKKQNDTLAAALIVLASAFIAAASLVAKALGTGTFGAPMHALQISHGRFLFAWLIIATTATLVRPQFEKPLWHMHVARTLCGWGGVTAMFAAVAFIPLADATAISFLNPVFAMVLAIPLLGEKVGPIRWCAAGMALIGAVVLLRPTTQSFEPAALIALGGAVVMGCELVFIKRLSRREGPFQILIINNSLGLLISSFAVLWVWQTPTASQWVFLAAIGGCMALAQTCFVNAMARADASFVAPFSYATLIFAALFDAAIFRVVPDIVTWIGAGIIIVGAVLLALREAHLKRSKVSPH